MKKQHVIIGILALASIIAPTHSKALPLSKKTHSDTVVPNYKEVFSEGEVKRIEIKIESSDWSAMWDDIKTNLGSNNRQMGRGGEGIGGGIGEGGGRGEGGGGARPTDISSDYSPIWRPCTITYNGMKWEQVGVRFKGNSSLMRASMEGNKKLSMKLNFDKYEDQYPELKNQRFYGFKKLNLNSNFNDTSFIKELVTSKIFKDFGMVAAQSVPCEIYIDFGEGLQYYGLYTILEEVDDSVIRSRFKDSSGNIYKPEERAGSFAEGTFNPNEFHIKSSAKKADYKDVEALYTILNSSERTSNEASWKNKLEAIFDVDVFLKWMAVNTTIQNWDTYGNMAHNYYLYNNPETNKLTWIPWDHNEGFQDGRNSHNPSQLGSVGAEWPLISQIIAVDEYKERYNSYLSDFASNIFTPSKMVKLYDGYYKLLKESVYREVTVRTYMRYYKMFDESIEAMKVLVERRKEVVNNYLANPSLVEELMGGRGGRGGFGERGREGEMGGEQRRAPFEGTQDSTQMFRRDPAQMGAQGDRPMGDRPMGDRPMGEMGDRPMGARGGRQMGMNLSTAVEGEPLPMENTQEEPPMGNNFRER